MSILLSPEELQQCGVDCFINYPKDPYKLGKQISNEQARKIFNEWSLTILALTAYRLF